MLKGQIYIDIPLFDEVNKLIFAEIRFEAYPRTRYYEQSKEVYAILGRKYGRKKDEKWGHLGVDSIKDWDKIQKFVKDQKKKNKKGIFSFLKK